MNRSLGSPQNNVRDDRWSPIWHSEAKIQLFLQNTAPLVTNGAETRSIENKMLKLTSTYEGLSIRPSKKKPSRKLQKLLDIAGFLRKKFLSLTFVGCSFFATPFTSMCAFRGSK